MIYSPCKDTDAQTKTRKIDQKTVHLKSVSDTIIPQLQLVAGGFFDEGRAVNSNFVMGSPNWEDEGGGAREYFETKI